MVVGYHGNWNTTTRIILPENCEKLYLSKLCGLKRWSQNKRSKVKNLPTIQT